MTTIKGKGLKKFEKDPSWHARKLQGTELEYGKNSLTLQKDSVKSFKSFAIVDDLLATGGTVKCASYLLRSLGKEITGLSVVAELEELNARKNLGMNVISQVKF